MNVNRNVVISVGPIPARVDSVKFITNRFKGGLALKTVQHLLDEPGIFVTIVAWKYTDIPYEIERCCANVFRVADVFEYYDWFVAHAKNYSAFVMAAAVANLTPVVPFEGKFPSHLYKPGEEFDIRFMIAPRAIDAIKSLNPRACLIGYKLFDAPDDAALVDIARHTLEDSHANVIFANTPKDAKSRKLALTQDGSVIPCTFQEHCDLIVRAIRQHYYNTSVEPLTEEELSDPDIQEALATVECFEGTFEKYGTVAVAVRNKPMFATTSRGHKGDPVIVRGVDHGRRIVHTSGKATLNAPAMEVLLERAMAADPEIGLVVHRHVALPGGAGTADPGNADVLLIGNGVGGEFTAVRMAVSDPSAYVFPGTAEEVEYVTKMTDVAMPGSGIYEPYHGYLLPRKSGPVDWTKYRIQFPERYFGVPEKIQAVIDRYADDDADTLEIGGNTCASAKFSYDPYVRSVTSRNLSLNDVMSRRFDLAYALNAVNYLSMDELKGILDHCEAFVANTFLEAPEKSVRGSEAAVLDGKVGIVRHVLRLPDDSVVRHSFHAYGRKDWEALGLSVLPYGKNSALVYKGLDLK